MSYELFRNEIAYHLTQSFPQDQVAAILKIIDRSASDYDVEQKPKAIITTDGIPEVVKYYIASKTVEHLSASTLNVYRLRLIDFFSMARKPFQDIHANDIRMYLYYYKEQHKAADSYLDNIRRILNSFFTWLVKNEYLLRNPCATIEHIKFQAKEREPLTPYELEVLRLNCETPREKALLDFLFSTGVRLSECRDVNQSDIDWNKRSVIIRHGKGDKRRTVFFNAEAEISLKVYLNSRTDDNDALFISKRRPFRRISNKGIQIAIAKVAARAKMHVYPHRLRHTFATSGINGGMPLEKLQALMGHAKPETTLVYAKLDNTDLQMTHRRIYA